MTKVNIYNSNGRVRATKYFVNNIDAEKFARNQSVFSYNRAISLVYENECLKIMKGEKSDLW